MEEAKKHGEDLLEDWLSQHKFKDWKETETAQTPVDDAMRRERAREIAELLGNPGRWHSHGRGITMADLRSEEVKLRINDFGADPSLNRAVRQYHELLSDFAARIRIPRFFHSQHGVRRF